MNKYIKARKAGRFESEKPFIFVVPVYLATIPEIVRRFISRSHFSGNRSAYFIATCVSDASAVPNAARKLCMESGMLTYMGSAKVQMPQNYIALFTMTEEAEQQARYQAAEQTIGEITGKILAGEVLPDREVPGIEYAVVNVVEKLYNRGFAKTKKFTVTDRCIGCSLCERSCPVNAIEMVHNKPLWAKKTCIHCMSCINRCPKQAIEYGRKTVDKKRYVCKKYTQMN